MRCAICYHLFNFKNAKNTHEGVSVLVKLHLPANLLKVTLILGYFSRFINCTNGTKSRNAPTETKWDLNWDRDRRRISNSIKLIDST